LALAAPASGSMYVTRTPAPLPAKAVTQQLTSVSMVSATDGWAVGWHSVGSTPEPFIEHWDGSSWARIHRLARSGFLDAVSADSSSDAWAVGSSTDGSHPVI